MSSTTTPPDLAAAPVLPVTGDDVVDAALDRLRGLLSAHEQDATAGAGDAEALAAVHDALQRRLSVTAG